MKCVAIIIYIKICRIAYACKVHCVRLSFMNLCFCKNHQSNNSNTLSSLDHSNSIIAFDYDSNNAGKSIEQRINKIVNKTQTIESNQSRLNTVHVHCFYLRKRQIQRNLFLRKSRKQILIHNFELWITDMQIQ